MTPITIRRLEIWLGKPACFLLTCFRFLSRIFRRKKDLKHPIKKVLFIKFVEQGAIVLAYTALCRVISMVGRKNVFICVFARNREILDLLNIIPSENVFTVRAEGFFAFLNDVIKNLIKIRRIGIDTTVDLEFFSRFSAIFAYVSGAKHRVGLHRFTTEAPFRGDLMTHRVQYNPYLHHARGYVLLIEALKKNIKEVPMLKMPVDKLHENIPKFKPLSGEKRQVQELIENSIKGKIKGPLILCNPDINGLLPIRNWPKERFIELGRKILSTYKKAVLVFIGVLKAREGTEEICKAIGSSRIVNLTGRTSLRELLVLYTESNLLVTTDSGPAHFTSMTDIKSVILYGPETPVLFGVWSKNAHIIQSDLACSPCLNIFNHRFSPCKDNVCMQSVSVKQVYEKVQLCLK